MQAGADPLSRPSRMSPRTKGWSHDLVMSIIITRRTVRPLIHVILNYVGGLLIKSERACFCEKGIGVVFGAE